jgi:hypothetical protein
LDSNGARLRLLQVAADLQVFCPDAWSSGASRRQQRSVNPTAEAFLRRTHVARLLDELKDEHLVV